LPTAHVPSHGFGVADSAVPTTSSVNADNPGLHRDQTDIAQQLQEKKDAKGQKRDGIMQGD
jgi:hypothetical protein